MNTIFLQVCVQINAQLSDKVFCTNEIELLFACVCKGNYILFVQTLEELLHHSPIRCASSVLKVAHPEHVAMECKVTITFLPLAVGINLPCAAVGTASGQPVKLT